MLLGNNCVNLRTKCDSQKNLKSAILQKNTRNDTKNNIYLNKTEY